MNNIAPNSANQGIPNYYGGDTPLGNNFNPEPPIESYTKHQFNGPYTTPTPMTDYRKAKPEPTKKLNRKGAISLTLALSVMLFFRTVPFLGVILSTTGVVFGHRSFKETKGQEFKIRSLGLYGIIAGYFAVAVSSFWTTIFVSGLIEDMLTLIP